MTSCKGPDSGHFIPAYPPTNQGLLNRIRFCFGDRESNFNEILFVLGSLGDLKYSM